jgi:hypothetical protein
MHRLVVVLLFVVAVDLAGSVEPRAQQATGGSRTPTARLTNAPPLRFKAPADSNSPAVWDLSDGVNALHVFVSSAFPTATTGIALNRLGPPTPIEFEGEQPGGIWMEAIVKDEGGAWYGYYHNEPPIDHVCEGIEKTMPRIGAARSTDLGRRWMDLGIILEAPPDAYDCASANKYFVGGLGDFSVMLDADRRDLYFFLSSYAAPVERQGISLARLTWADRDQPRGRLAVWQDGIWRDPTIVAASPRATEYEYPPPTPILGVSASWHEADGPDGGYWGPSVHWNTYLNQYVMLLNKSADPLFNQEGIYVSYSRVLTDPRAWSPPARLLAGGRWYPQIMGLEVGAGTDKLAGQTARFFMSGESSHLIRFTR